MLLLKLAVLIALTVPLLTPPAYAHYTGKLRVYVAEPTSRWHFDTGETIRHGCLDFAIVQTANVPDNQTQTFSTVWDASTDAGYGGVTPTNIELMAVLFDPTGHVTDAWPPAGYWFTAYYADACAAATPGVPGRDQSNANLTHTVFCEEGSATWCHNCPNVSAQLHALELAPANLFKYVALVAETPEITEPAYTRLMTDLNRPGYPCCYFDGGYSIVIGDLGQPALEAQLAVAAARTPINVDLVARMVHLNTDQYFIAVRAGYLVTANAAMPTPCAPSGPTSGSPGTPLTFQSSATDPEADSLFYQFDFDEDKESEWLGPFASGQTCSQQYTYPSAGSYDVRVRVKDVWGETSAWSPELEVTIGGDCCNVRGDFTHDGTSPDISDLVGLVGYMFGGGLPPVCKEEMDVNGSGGDPDISDLVRLVDFMFGGGAPLTPCP